MQQQQQASSPTAASASLNPTPPPASAWRSRSGSLSTPSTTMNASAASAGAVAASTSAATLLISPRTSSLSHDNPATFMGPSAELFDRMYVRADRNFGDQVPHLRGDEDEDDASSLKEILAPFPSPDPLTSYWEYELELISWRSSVERAVGAIKLPTLVGRHLYRPQTDSGATAAMVSTPVSSASSSVTPHSPSPNTASPLPSSSTSSSYAAYGGRRISVDASSGGANLNSFRHALASSPTGMPLSSPRSLSLLLEQDDDSSPSESNAISGSAGSSGGGSPDNTSLVMGSMGSSSSNNSSVEASSASEDPWDTLLVPAEPNPTQFSSFDDYYVAMLRWANTCQLSHGYAIPTACNSLPSLLPLHRTTKSRANSSAQGSFAPPALRKRGWASAESLLFGGEYQPMQHNPQHPITQVRLPSATEGPPAVLSSAPIRILDPMVWGNVSLVGHIPVAMQNPLPTPGPVADLARTSSVKSAGKILKGVDKIIKRAQSYFSSTGRTSAPLRALPGVSLPEEETRSPVHLLQHPSNGTEVQTKRSFSTAEFYTPAKRRRRNTASFENTVLDQWPSPSQTHPVASVCESLRVILRSSSMSSEWQRARIQLPWVGKGDPPFPPTGPVLTISDLCLHLVDSLFACKDDQSAALQLCHVFSQMRAENSSIETLLSSASLLSMLIRASATFVGMISTCIRSIKSQMESVPAVTVLQILRDTSFFLSLLQPEQQDVYWFPDDLFAILKHTERTAGAVKLVEQAVAIYYVGLLDRFTESELRRHMQVDRIESPSSLCFSSRSWLQSSTSDFVGAASSTSAVKSLSRLLSHRSPRLSSVGYFVLSTFIRTDPSFKSSSSFFQLLRSLHDKKRHVRWIQRRLGSILLSSSAQQFPSLCASLSYDDILSDICYPKNASQLLWWDRIYMKLASEVSDTNVFLQIPALFHSSLAESILDRICSTKIKLELGGNGLEFERCFLSARLLNLQASIFSTICYVLAKNQAVSLAPKPGKDETVFKPTFLSLVKLLHFVQSPHSVIPAASPAGRQHAAARASAALAVSYLFGERSVVTSLSKWWKKSPRGLVKLVEKPGAHMKSSTRFKSMNSIPSSPLLAVAYILVGMIKQSAFYDYSFGSTVLHSLNCLLISHPRVASSFTETPRLLKSGLSQQMVDSGDDPIQPLLLQLIEGFALNSGATSNLPSVAHFCRAITLLFSGVIFDKDVKNIAEYLLKHHHYIKINLAVRKVQDLVPGILFVVIKELTTTLSANTSAAKLIKSIDIGENL
jgi:hypothetical protein